MSLTRASNGLCLLMLLAAGCAKTATFRQLRPAQATPPARRLVLLDVDGPEVGRGEVQRTVWSGLAESGAFVLAGERDLMAAAPAPLRLADGSANMPAILEAARRLGIAGVVLTELRYVESDGKPYGSKSVRFGDPNVAAKVDYRIVDARTMQVLGRNTIHSEYRKGELDPSTETGPNSESKVLKRLADEASARVVAALAPHERDVEVKLADSMFVAGSSQVSDGNRAAREGDWKAAIEQWQLAATVNPNNSAAWYNLGLGHEARGRFDLARQTYARAVSLQDDKLYREALVRIDDAAEQSRLAVAQRLPTLPPTNVGIANTPPRRPPTSLPARFPRGSQSPR